MIMRYNVKSSAIRTVGYNTDDNTLMLTFHSGPHAYSYGPVPMKVAREMVAAPSVGRYFHKNIKGKYEIYE